MSRPGLSRRGLLLLPTKNQFNTRIYSPPPQVGMANETYIRLLFFGASVIVDSKYPSLLAYNVHCVIVTL